MSGYVYRDPARGAAQVEATAAAQRLAKAEQQRDQLAARVELLERAVTSAAEKQGFLQAYNRRHRIRAKSNTARVHALLAALRAEREQRIDTTSQRLAAEQSRRTHAEAALSRSEQRTDSVRAELADEQRAHQITRAELTQARAELATTPPAPSVVPLERRITDLEGALADSQQVRDDAVEERDEAVALAMGMQVAMDQAHTTLTAALPQMWEISRRAHQIEDQTKPSRKAS